jgi:hypothetical protein
VSKVRPAAAAAGKKGKGSSDGGDAVYCVDLSLHEERLIAEALRSSSSSSASSKTSKSSKSSSTTAASVVVDGQVTVAAMPALGQITLVSQTGALTTDDVATMVTRAVDACAAVAATAQEQLVADALQRRARDERRTKKRKAAEAAIIE